MGSHREGDDDYDYVVAWLGREHRLIECKDNIQWILQAKAKKDARWRNEKYFRSRDAMLEKLATLPNVGTLADLPERYASVRGRDLRYGA